jgi:hypothetical protein
MLKGRPLVAAGPTTWPRSGRLPPPPATVMMAAMMPMVTTPTGLFNHLAGFGGIDNHAAACRRCLGRRGDAKAEADTDRHERGDEDCAHFSSPQFLNLGEAPAKRRVQVPTLVDRSVAVPASLAEPGIASSVARRVSSPHCDDEGQSTTLRLGFGTNPVFIVHLLFIVRVGINPWPWANN